MRPSRHYTLGSLTGLMYERERVVGWGQMVKKMGAEVTVAGQSVLMADPQTSICRFRRTYFSGRIHYRRPHETLQPLGSSLPPFDYLNTRPFPQVRQPATMTDTRNRSQRREDLRRAIKNRKGSMIERATIDKRMARQQDAQEINRGKAMRAVGVTDDVKSGWRLLSMFEKRRIDIWQGLVFILLLLTMMMLGVYTARTSYPQMRKGSGIGMGLMSYGESALSVI